MDSYAHQEFLTENVACGPVESSIRTLNVRKEVANGNRDVFKLKAAHQALDEILTRESAFTTRDQSLAAYRTRVMQGKEKPELLEGESTKDYLHSLGHKA